MNQEEFIEQWRKENNTEGAVYSHYHYDAMEAYAKEQVIKELEKVETFKHWGRLTDHILSRIKQLSKQNFKKP